MLQPWASRRDESLLRYRVTWHVLMPVRVAILDERLGRSLADWPQVMSALLERAIRRTHRMSIHEALLQLSPVETRLLVLFWHLAERWGNVTPGGVALRLRLPHALLGQLVGCQRSSVTTALQHIYSSGHLRRRPDGSWLLAGAPPDDMVHVHWHAPSMAIPRLGRNAGRGRLPLRDLRAQAGARHPGQPGAAAARPAARRVRGRRAGALARVARPRDLRPNALRLRRAQGRAQGDRARAVRHARLAPVGKGPHPWAGRRGTDRARSLQRSAPGGFAV